MGTFTPSFPGEVAFVTGAGGGMGRAICVAFAQAGATVVMADIDGASGAETERLVRDAGRRRRRSCAPTSPTPTRSPPRSPRRTDRFGRLDVAVNAAAIESETAPLHECDDAVFDRMQAVNVRGLFLCMKHELRAMLGPGARRGDRQHRVDQLVPPPARPAGVHRVEARRDRAHAARPRTTTRRTASASTRSARARSTPRCCAARSSAAAATRRTSPTGSACSAASAGPRRSRPGRCGCARTASSFTTGHPLAVDAGYLARLTGR